MNTLLPANHTGRDTWQPDYFVIYCMSGVISLAGFLVLHPPFALYDTRVKCVAVDLRTCELYFLKI